MKFYIVGVISLIMLLIVACGSQSKNMSKKGSFFLSSSGIAKDGFNFERSSWYSELNMVLDIYTLKVVPTVSYMSWFGKNTQNKIKECSQFYVLMTYILDTSVIPFKMVSDQMENQGFEQISVADFSSNLNLHPDFKAESLQLYKVYGFCSKRPHAQITINLPHFKALALN